MDVLNDKRPELKGFQKTFYEKANELGSIPKAFQFFEEKKELIKKNLKHFDWQDHDTFQELYEDFPPSVVVKLRNAKPVKAKVKVRI